jgi:murein L,D-transpeptidase YafK
MKWVRTLLLLCGVLATPSDAYSQGAHTVQRMPPRVQQAFKNRAAAVESQFLERGATWPPKKILLRAFKLEGQLELWAPSARTPGSFIKVRSFPICASSGNLGPKLESGDGQVPEGVYYINRFNPRSSYHLSLGINYPNALDRRRSRGRDAGGDIFVHGDCVTIGCLPLQNTPMEDLYLVALQARRAGQRRIPIHMAPCRFDTDRCEEALRSQDPQHAILWASLRTIHRRFEATRRPPKVIIERERVYRLAHPKGQANNRLGRWSGPALSQEQLDRSPQRERGPELQALWNRKRSIRLRRIVRV